MAEGVDHAFIGENPIGERDFVANGGELIGHGVSPCVICWRRKAETRRVAKALRKRGEGLALRSLQDPSLRGA
jgi:hypothetical protein